MDTNKMREQFEAWINSYIGSTWLKRNDHQLDEYLDENAQFMWEAWQASRAAVVVELPDRKEGKYCSLRGFDEVRFCADVTAAIKAQGLKVEVKP